MNNSLLNELVPKVGKFYRLTRARAFYRDPKNWKPFSVGINQIASKTIVFVASYYQVPSGPTIDSWWIKVIYEENIGYIITPNSWRDFMKEEPLDE